jgi:hypothetical protein
MRALVRILQGPLTTRCERAVGNEAQLPASPRGMRGARAESHLMGSGPCDVGRSLTLLRGWVDAVSSRGRGAGPRGEADAVVLAAGFPLDVVGRGLVAGLTLLAIAVPEQFTTARLAGMSPITGLYAFVAGSAMFALLGSNRQMSVGADSMIAPLFAGVIVALIGLLRIGWIAEFLSAPIITGFMGGVAVITVVHQLPDLLGVPGRRQRAPSYWCRDERIASGQRLDAGHRGRRVRPRVRRRTCRRAAYSYARPFRDDLSLDPPTSID